MNDFVIMETRRLAAIFNVLKNASKVCLKLCHTLENYNVQRSNLWMYSHHDTSVDCNPTVPYLQDFRWITAEKDTAFDDFTRWYRILNNSEIRPSACY